MIRFFFSLVLLVSCLVASGQRSRFEQERTNDGSILLLNFTYSGYKPAGDLADRFEGNFGTGLSVDYFTKRNWIIGLQGDFHFGKKVKEDVLANLRSTEGVIFADDGGPADVQLRERGIAFTGHIGRVFSLSPSNKRSGIKVTLGTGFWQHKIRIQDEPQVFVSGLSDTYKKGYDRLSNGLALTQFIGYQLLSNNRLINFSIGAEFFQGFLQGRRSFNFDTRAPGLEKRFDVLYGFRLNWTLPLFVGQNPDEIYY